MKIKLLFVLILFGVLCILACQQKENCVNCTLEKYKTQVCKLPNGNAELEGKDSGKPYDEFINSIISRGGECK